MTLSKSFSQYATAAVASLVLATCAHAGSIGKTVKVETRLPDASTVNPVYTHTYVIDADGADFSQPGYFASVTDNKVSLGGWLIDHTFMHYAFNGTVLQTAGGWSSYSIDPSSNLAGFTLDRISTVGNELLINLQGLSVDATSRLTLNVSAVPEPETYAMLVAGLALVGVARRRARN